MEDNSVVLYTEDGDTVKFKVLGVVKHDRADYVVLTACDDELEPVTILHLVGTVDGQELFERVDWDLLVEIWDVFCEQNADRFEFLDD